MEKRKFRFSRLFVIVVGSIAFLLFAAYSWGFQTILWWQYNGLSKSSPILKLKPQNLPSAPPNLAEGTRLSHASFEFEVPWADLDSQKSKFVKNIAIYALNSGRVLEFFGPGDHEDLFSTVEKSFDDKKGVLRSLFGEQATKSDYTFRKTLLEQTPDELRPWMSHREAFRVSYLLMIKNAVSVGGETGLFNVETPGWKGFQFDCPAKKPKKVTLELNDLRDQHVEIIFIPGKGVDAGITQSDVNRVLQTLAPAGANAALLENHAPPRSNAQKKP